MPVASEVVPNNAMGVIPGGSMQYLITVTELNGIPGYCQVCWHSFPRRVQLGEVIGFFFDTIPVKSICPPKTRAGCTETLLGHSEWLTGRKPNE